MTLTAKSNGFPSEKHYTLGRGRVYFGIHDANQKPTSWRDLGNCNSFTMSAEVEEAIHRTSRSGLSTIDKKILISRDFNGSLILDEIVGENVALWFGGYDEDGNATETYTNTTDQVTPVGTNVATGDGSTTALADLDIWYDVYFETVPGSSGIYRRAYNLDEVVDASGLEVIAAATPTPVPLVIGDDYELNQEAGMIRLLSTGTNAAAMAADPVVIRIATAPGSPTNPTKVLIGQRSVVGSLKLVVNDPEEGKDVGEILLNKVTLSPDGDMEWISQQDFMEMPFSFAAEANTAISTTSPVGEIVIYK